jgi:anti-anti-sigma factor
MKLSLVSIEKEGFIRIATDGNITSTDFQADGRNPLEQIMGQTWSSNKVLLDMDKTNYIDSTAIGWLISCHKEFKNKGGVFVVHSVQPAVKQVLDLLKIGKVVPIVENEAAARAFAIGAA